MLLALLAAAALLPVSPLSATGVNSPAADDRDPSRIELTDNRSLASASGVGFDLSWWTIDGGGGAISGGGFTLDGTLGQPDASAMKGGGFTLGGGFWPVDQPFASHIFHDRFEVDSGASVAPIPAHGSSP